MWRQRAGAPRQDVSHRRLQTPRRVPSGSPATVVGLLQMSDAFGVSMTGARATLEPTSSRRHHSVWMKCPTVPSAPVVSAGASHGSVICRFRVPEAVRAAVRTGAHPQPFHSRGIRALAAGPVSRRSGHGLVTSRCGRPGAGGNPSGGARVGHARPGRCGRVVAGRAATAIDGGWGSRRMLASPAPPTPRTPTRAVSRAPSPATVPRSRPLHTVQRRLLPPPPIPEVTPRPRPSATRIRSWST